MTTATAAWGAIESVVQLGDLDLLRRELEDAGCRSRLKKMGFSMDGARKLEAARERIASGLEPRWMFLYQRAAQRYGRAVAAVRSRVCVGCFVTLPTTARPTSTGHGALGVCQSCGRILFWG